MKSKGYIDPNPDFLEELFCVIVNRLLNNQAQLAIWLLEEFDLAEFGYQRIGQESPFIDSNSKLAGSGFLISLYSIDIEKLVEVLSLRLTYEILHMEIESKGKVQFAAYDHFSYVLFGDDISLCMLEDIKNREIIFGYEMFNNE